jgi:integrase
MVIERGFPMKLSAANVKALTVPAGKTEAVFFDDEVHGFGVRVKASGTASYVMCWKVKTLDGTYEHRRRTIGTVSTIDFKKAKDEAKDIRYQVGKGRDPVAEVKTAKLETGKTFEILVGQFLDSLRDRYRPRSFVEIKRHLSKDAADLNTRPAAKVTRQDIAAVLAAITKNSGHVTANHVRTSLNNFFGWLIQCGHADTNPVTGTMKHKEKSRERVLTPAELRLIWNALGDDDYSRVIKLLALTGARASEIGALRREEIHESLIVLPGGHLQGEKYTAGDDVRLTKNGHSHTIPLAPAALELIRQQEARITAGQQFLFGGSKRGFSDWGNSRDRLDARIKEANNGKEIAPRWTVHDLRRSLATYITGGMKPAELAKLPERDRELVSGLGVQPHVLKAVLNHAGDSDVTAIYARTSYETDKRHALTLWAAHLLAIVEGRDSNVTPLQRKA